MSYLIRGNKCLQGEIVVSGSKNSLLPILAASCICKSIINLSNVAPLEDTYAMIEILRYLNVNVIYDNKDKMIIDSRNIRNKKLNIKEVSHLRASYYFMGALLSMYNKISILTPGGCDFASRPIDLHLYAFKELGFSNEIKDSVYIFTREKESKSEIEFSKISVGATINAILASVRNRGKTVIKNISKEPEVIELIEFLNRCGANINVEGNSVIINGVNKLKGCSYEIIDDRIEAQTYMILGALCGKNLKIKYRNKEHVKALENLFKELNIDIKNYNDGLIVNKVNSIEAKDLVFDVYPSLPTDVQPLLSILFSKSKGETSFVDKVYPSRYSQIKELVSMGYNFKVENNKLIIRKNILYKDSEVACNDLRGGMSLVIAALVSDKTTIITSNHHIKRGYYNLVSKLKKVGALIEEI